MREALRAGTRPILRLLVVREDAQFADLVRRARSAHIPVHIEPRPMLDRLVPAGKHQGIIGIVGAKGYSDLDEILGYARGRNEPPAVIILDGVEDPQNLGAVLRTAEGAGAHGVIIPDRRSVGLTAAVARASAGAVEHLRVACVPNLSRVIEQVQSAGLWVYGLIPEAPKPYTALDLQGPVALVFGSEGRGIREGVSGKCDERAAIPLRGKVDSLNVSAAVAIVLFEMVRQRTAKQ